MSEELKKQERPVTLSMMQATLKFHRKMETVYAGVNRMEDSKSAGRAAEGMLKTIQQFHEDAKNMMVSISDFSWDQLTNDFTVEELQELLNDFGFVYYIGEGWKEL